ncbi:MAG: FmdE family protein [Chloroflexota bacterium]|nr:FmdE family protein [Chloroflexota bacterium]
MHKHLCPRQVLGVRMGLLAGKMLGLEVPREDKRLYAFTESDGCFADGLSVATGCWLGHRNLRLVDYGKVAATFVDTESGRALRIKPRPQARKLAHSYMPQADDRWHAQLEAYQFIPEEELLDAEEVTLNVPLDKIISKPGMRVICQQCGEEVMNEREVNIEGRLFCRGCTATGESRYYSTNCPQTA